MNDFFSSVKADLLDRRMLPLLLLLGAALAGALAYIVLGQSSSTGASPAAASAAPAATGGIAVSLSSPTGSKPVSETTGGSLQQREGASHDPFAPLPVAKAVTVTSASKSTTAAAGKSSAGSSSGTPSKGAGGTAPTSTTAPAKKPTTPTQVFSLTVRFGVATAGVPAPASQLTPYDNLKLLTPLPSAKLPLMVFRGVTAGGKSATFTLAGEAILHGVAVCLPSTSQCQAIELKPGQAEQFEYLPSSGPAITYELQVVSIVSTKASSASAQHTFASQSTAGRELLRRAGLSAVPGLRYSQAEGVLVLAGH